jgi:hypothetical protein
MAPLAGVAGLMRQRPSQSGRTRTGGADRRAGVIEVITVQALPEPLRSRAIAIIRRLVALAGNGLLTILAEKLRRPDGGLWWRAELRRPA